MTTEQADQIISLLRLIQHDAFIIMLLMSAYIGCQIGGWLARRTP